MRSTRLARKAPAREINVGILCFALFVAIVALMGGGSRSDISSLPLLRGLAVVFAGFALATMPPAALRPYRLPLLIFLLLAGWMAIQQLPMPPAVWQSLAGRELIQALDQRLGMVDQWRSISLAPSHTANSMFALVVPIAALLTAVTVPVPQRKMFWWIIWFFGIASAVLSLMQFVAGPGSAAYLYRITNGTSLVGLFSNRNHNAVLLSIALMSSGWLAFVELQSPKRRTGVLFALAASVLTFLLIILAIGSRLGFICGIVGFFVGYALFMAGYERRPPKRPRQTTKALPPPKRQLTSGGSPLLLRAGLPVIMLTLLTIMFYFSERANSLSRLVNEKADDEVRLQALPQILDLLTTYGFLGAGFGTFPRIFQIVEPDSMLSPTYLNHAHNDWLQFPIEGGVPAVLLLLAGLAWLVWTFVRHRGHSAAPNIFQTAERRTIAAGLLVFVLASAVDYPLRTPSLAMVAVLLAVMLQTVNDRDSNSHDSVPSKP